MNMVVSQDLTVYFFGEESVPKLCQNRHFLANLIIWLKCCLETIYVSIVCQGNINTNELYPISSPKEMHFYSFAIPRKKTEFNTTRH